MSYPEISTAMASFLRLMAEEIEKNQALAKRMSVPFKEMMDAQAEKAKVSRSSKRKVQEENAVPEGFDPFRIYNDLGSVGLFASLQDFDTKQCKAILSHFAMDPGRSYALWRKKERLADFIVERVKAMSERGKVFLD
ncbi:MAG: hypothetical protein PHF24_06070 [Syntrophomonas sp.]|nr:hypothetical protein [Syntrophomonas sp.]